jgi:hypothetical protein
MACLFVCEGGQLFAFSFLRGVIVYGMDFRVPVIFIFQLKKRKSNVLHAGRTKSMTEKIAEGRERGGAKKTGGTLQNTSKNKHFIL